ncbi:28S ribosomal protein S2, mitochondrial [Aplysia californica]|uniref:28S ribosomal protein S2, mitochondrial n=1 Tax=Aplysia californica TaxID=6500 RepID=A0ABM0K0T2_APLCA|nr:28S ribosomal protein S2, mitochondrial [Aplysia californica]
MSLYSRMIRWRACQSVKSCCSLHKTALSRAKVNLEQVARFSGSKLVCNQQEVEAPTPMRGEETESVADTALQHDDYFGLKNLVTVRDLFEARVHLGHNSGLRHESMSPYIFGERQGTDIIDLEQTLPLLQHALDVCAHIVYRGGMVLFLSRNQQTLPWVERMAQEVGEYSHCRPWKRGIFTNASSIFSTLPIYPELCVFLGTQDTVFEMHLGIVESSKLLIPSIGVVDSNCDNSDLTYHVPGNDDTPAAIHLYLRLFREAVTRAKAKRKEDGLSLDPVAYDES